MLHHILHGEHRRILCESRHVLRPSGALTIFDHNAYNPLAVRAVNTCPFDENAELLRPRQSLADVDGAGFSASSAVAPIFPRALIVRRRFEASMNRIPLGVDLYALIGYLGSKAFVFVQPAALATEDSSSR